MNYESLSVTDFKAEADALLDRLQETPCNLILTKGERTCAVVQDFTSWCRQRAGVLMLKLLVQGEADAACGRVTGQDQILASARRRLELRSGG